MHTLMNLPNRTGILLTKQKIQNYANTSISKFSLFFYSKLPYLFMASSTVISPLPTWKDATRI